MSASATASRLRHERDQLVASLVSGESTLASLGPAADFVKVVVLAQALPGVGKVKSRRVLDSLGVAPDARWGDLEAPAQADLIKALAGAADA